MNAKILAAGTLAYTVPVFLLAYPWHMVYFAGYYESLAIYRADKLVPLGVASMLLQGAVMTLLYDRLFGGGPALRNGLLLSLLVAPFFWSLAVLAVAAKFPMTSVAGFMTIETAFTVLQFLVAGPAVALAHRLFTTPVRGGSVAV